MEKRDDEIDGLFVNMLYEDNLFFIGGIMDFLNKLLFYILNSKKIFVSASRCIPQAYSHMLLRHSVPLSGEFFGALRVEWWNPTPGFYLNLKINIHFYEWVPNPRSSRYSHIFVPLRHDDLREIFKFQSCEICI